MPTPLTTTLLATAAVLTPWSWIPVVVLSALAISYEIAVAVAVFIQE